MVRFLAFLAALAVALPLTLLIGWAIALPAAGESVLAACLGLGLADVFDARLRRRLCRNEAD